VTQARPAKVARTTLLTIAATVWATAIASDWVPLPDAGPLSMIVAVLVFSVMVGLPLYSIKQAVLDARALESTGPWNVMFVFRWLLTLANVIVNFMLIALALFFAAMLTVGPIVA
jgi:hypothetical protein